MAPTGSPPDAGLHRPGDHAVDLTLDDPGVVTDPAVKGVGNEGVAAHLELVVAGASFEVEVGEYASVDVDGPDRVEGQALLTGIVGEAGELALDVVAALLLDLLVLVEVGGLARLGEALAHLLVQGDGDERGGALAAVVGEVPVDRAGGRGQKLIAGLGRRPVGDAHGEVQQEDRAAEDGCDDRVPESGQEHGFVLLPRVPTWGPHEQGTYLAGSSFFSSSLSASLSPSLSSFFFLSARTRGPGSG